MIITVSVCLVEHRQETACRPTVVRYPCCLRVGNLLLLWRTCWLLHYLFIYLLLEHLFHVAFHAHPWLQWPRTTPPGPCRGPGILMTAKKTPKTGLSAWISPGIWLFLAFYWKKTAFCANHGNAPNPKKEAQSAAIYLFICCSNRAKLTICAKLWKQINK